jgi:hypothetical protein
MGHRTTTGANTGRCCLSSRDAFAGMDHEDTNLNNDLVVVVVVVVVVLVLLLLLLEEQSSGCLWC